jgi:signal transduction histidine kinase
MGLPDGVGGAVPSGDLAPAPSRDDRGILTTQKRAGGGLRASDLVPAAERHVVGLSVTTGLALAAIAVVLATEMYPVLAVGALGAGAAVVVRGYVRRRAETVRLAKLLADQTRILEMVATGAPLPEVLDALCRVVESQVPGLICSVLLLEGDRLRDGAGPSLPDAYRQGIDGVAIGPEVGSCGTAAYHRRPVVVRDIAGDPLWKDYRELALAHGLMACWSAPILTPGDECLGTFAMYYREPRRPGTREWRLLETATHIARVAIIRARTEEALAASHRRLEEESEVASALVRVGQGLISSLDKPDILERLCQLTTELIGCDCSLTILHEPQDDVYVPLTSHGYPADTWATLRSARYPASGVAPILTQLETVPVVQFFAGDSNPATAGLLQEYGLTACLVVPLRHGGETLGLLSAGFRRLAVEFTPVQERVAFGIAQFASLAFENARLVEELETATRLKIEFMSTISHELRTPLGVMLGYAEMLGDEGEAAQRTSLLARIRRTGVELLELIDATLNLNRLEAGQDPPRLEPVALRDFFSELAADFAALPRPDGVELRWRPGDELSLLTDRRKLRMILKNLVGNALKFTPDGSVTVRYASDPGRCTFEVEDTGVGIAPEHLPVIFEMFRQADGSSQRSLNGVGLGLYIVRRLVNQLGGEVRVASAPGHGSTFTVTLPRSRSEARLSA